MVVVVVVVVVVVGGGGVGIVCVSKMWAPSLTQKSTNLMLLVVTNVVLRNCYSECNN